MSPRLAIPIILLIWISGLGAAAQFSKFAVLFPFVRATFPQAGAEIGWVVTLISLIGAFLGIVAGTLVARFGCARLLVLGLVLGGAVSLWQGMGLGFSTLLFSRIVEGISHLVIVVAAPTLIAQISPDAWRGAFMSLWSTFFGVAFALTAWFGIPFVDSFGLFAFFSFLGAAMLALAAALALAFTLTGVGAATGLVERGSVLARQWNAYRSPFVAAPALGWLFYTFTFVALLALLPDMLPEHLRVQIAGLMPLASIAVSLGLVPLMLTRMAAVNVVIVGFLVSAGVIATIFLGAPVAIVAVAVFGTLGFVQGASFAAVPELNESMEDRALANGCMAQMGNVGNLLGTPVLLAFIDRAGNSASFVAIMGIYGLAAIVHLCLSRARRTRGA